MGFGQDRDTINSNPASAATYHKFSLHHGSSSTVDEDLEVIYSILRLCLMRARYTGRLEESPCRLFVKKKSRYIYNAKAKNPEPVA